MSRIEPIVPDSCCISPRFRSNSFRRTLRYKNLPPQLLRLSVLKLDGSSFGNLFSPFLFIHTFFSLDLIANLDILPSMCLFNRFLFIIYIYIYTHIHKRCKLQGRRRWRRLETRWRVFSVECRWIKKMWRFHGTLLGIWNTEPRILM